MKCGALSNLMSRFYHSHLRTDGILAVTFQFESFSPATLLSSLHHFTFHFVLIMAVCTTCTRDPIRHRWAPIVYVQVILFLIYCHTTLLSLSELGHAQTRLLQQQNNTLSLLPLDNTRNSTSTGAPPKQSQVKQQQQQTLATKTQQRQLVHLHIGKNGGTSLDSLGRRIATESGRRYKGRRHFDWSLIETLPQDTTDVITVLRDPVKRAVSHFYYARTLPWTQKLHIRDLNLTEYLHDKSEMLRTRSIWFDGQAGVSWLTGTHVDPWVGGPKTKEEIQQREIASQNSSATCLLAADRLDQTLWFGIIEDLPRSMELLQHALGLSKQPSLPKKNSHSSNPKPSEFEEDALASLMPRDMWLYEYGKRLFEARYHAMQTGVFIPPDRPSFPATWSCSSSRVLFDLDCVVGPMKGLHQLDQTEREVIAKQEEK